MNQLRKATMLAGSLQRTNYHCFILGGKILDNKAQEAKIGIAHMCGDQFPSL